MPQKTPEELQDQLFQERFDRFDEKLDDIKDMLGNKATAGSVYRLETRMKNLEDSHIPCATVMIVKKQLEEMELKIAPVIEATDGAVYFTKHPAQLKMVIAGALVLLVIYAVGLVPSWLMWRRYALDKQVQKTEIPKGAQIKK